MARFRSLKRPSNMSAPVVSSGDYFPSFYVNEDEFPEIKTWKPGEEYECEVKLVMTSRNTNESDGKPKKFMSATIELRAVKIEKEEEKMLSGYSK